MTAKRPTSSGSFGGHFEDLVKQFAHDRPEQPSSSESPRERDEKRDIHAMLFERAWRMGMDKSEG